MRKQIKSQITMLMIVGLMLFIIVSFVLYLSKSTVKKQSQQSVKKTEETALKTQPIREFVQKCLDKLAKDAVVLLGKQGGYIYKSQGGTLIDYLGNEGQFFVKHNNLNVAYNILPPKFAAPPYSSDIPAYPWAEFPYITKTSDTEIFEGYFGISKIPPLTPSEGPHSIQTQIEAFIDNNIANCADFSIFKQQGFDINMQQSKTSVIIGISDVSIRSKIPITINNSATNEFAEFSDFSSSIDIRLKEIYFFTKELIQNDIENIKFDIDDTANNKDLLSVRLINNVYANNDLIIVTDEKSLVYGKPFEYVFARKNRAPALYYIKKNVLEFEHNHEIRREELLSDTEPKAEDPDEDLLEFKFYRGERGNNEISFPVKLNTPQIDFRMEVNDGKLRDYQIITVNRK